jgi:ABC-type antimicrobial peptide transport system permease subunit
VIGELDPAVAIGTIRTLEEVIDTSPTVARTSLTLLLLGIGAAMGLLLSAVGLFGVLAHLVGQRQVEIGIRMAIGAPRRQVAALVVGNAMRLASIGVALGLVGAAVSTRLLASLLFEVRPGDPVTLATATFILVLVVLFATWLPARRAARIDPMVALRTD